MPKDIKSLKVFLASPGDLVDERKAAKVAVEEINSTLAEPLGFIFQLIGWEDTTSTYGRPQETINKEIKECDIFVGMVWERWGTPPDNEGKYQSGFEEEYELALSLKEKKDKPEISLFLKKINPKSKNDPGDQLKKVLEFRENLNNEKKVLYKEFDHTNEFSSLLRRLLADRIHDLNQTDREKEQRKTESTQTTKIASEEASKEKDNKKILPENSESFLKKLLEQNDNPEITRIDPFDSAKLRLISRIFRTNQNDDSAVGIHDINILYEMGSEDFSRIENFQLLQDALSFYETDNAPLWKWYTFLTRTTEFDFSRLIFKSGNCPLKEAFKAMRLIGCPITETKKLTRSEYISTVFSEHDENTNKEFLEYLSHYGKDADLPLIKDLIDEASFSLKNSAIDCYLRIVGKSSIESAICAALDFEATGRAVRELFKNSHAISDAILEKCLNSQSEDIISRAAYELLNRKKINEKQARKLTQSKHIEIRYIGVLALSSIGELLERETADSIIGDDGKSSLLGISLNAKTSFDFKRDYFYYYLRKIDQVKLKTLVDYEPFLHVEPLIIFFERNIKKRIEEIRDNIDNKFSPEIERRSNIIKSKYGEKNNILKDFLALHRSQEPEVTRKLLSILIKQNKKEDLPRLRKTLSRPDIAISSEDIIFLEKHGEWEDISLINEKFKNKVRQSIYSEESSDDKNLETMASKCILKISKGREDDLLSMSIEDGLMREIIIGIPESRLKSLDNDTIFLLLNDEDDDVRRFLTCKICKAFSKKDLERLEKKYFSRFERRYYNVIHWLDFGKNIQKDQLKKSLNKVLNRELTW
ncbi:DUF4062 domain-containing protein [Marinobacter adhaerens]|uniref:DUF4062 domain-containing protein n=1 Tax=Marinobacter adhaerens TaxID=1033846 RepID=UPI003C4B123A